MTEEERQSIIDEIKEQLLADMVDITKLPKGDATDGASLPVLQHSELVIQELNNFIGVYDIDVERQSADSDIVNIYLKNAAGVVIKTIVTNAATLEQVNTKVAKINESLTLISSSLSAKQDTLKSGVNIKTINGTSLLGSGDVSISGGSGGDFNSSGTYPNLTAGKATKLATARTISLSGATVGSATFDGTKDVDININSIPQGYIQWAGKNSIGSLSPLEATAPLFSTNRFALINPECVIIEYSQDGGNTWIKHPKDASPSAKTYLFTPEVSTVNLALGNKASNQETTPLDMLRVTINGIAMTRYFSINTFLVSMSNINDSSVRCSFSRTTRGGDIINSKDYQVIGWPAWNTINLTTPIPFGNSNSAIVTKEITFTFKLIRNVARPPMVCNIACIANTLYNIETEYPKTGHLYKFDYLKNATFPARVTAAKHITQGGSANQVVLGDGSLRPISELSPITDADADILLDNHIHSIDIKANGNNVNINVIESSKNGDTWETEDNDIPIPLATPTSAGVMSKEDKAKLDGNISIEPDSGMPDLIGDFEYSDVDYEAIIDLTTVDWINWVEGGLFMMNAEETWEEDNGDTSYHQCVVTFIYRSNGCIPISIVNTNKMTAKMSGMVITINLTEGTGELRFKQIKLI